MSDAETQELVERLEAAERERDEYREAASTEWHRAESAEAQRDALREALEKIASGEWGVNAPQYDYDVRTFARTALAASPSGARAEEPDWDEACDQYLRDQGLPVEKK